MLEINVNKLINNSGFSIRKIAEFTTLPYSTLYQITTGLQVNPTILTLIKLATHFEVSIETLVYGEVGQANTEKNKETPKINIARYVTALNQKLTTLCKGEGLSLADLTRLSGIPRSTLDDLLKPRLIDASHSRSTRLNTIAPLAKAFHITLDELIGF